MFEVQDKGGDKKIVFVKGEVNAQTGSELKKRIYWNYLILQTQ